MQRPIRLLVNADDGGIDRARNRGIARTFRDGIVRSATVLANAPAFEDLVKEARRHPGLGIGLHINISEGVPLAAGHRTLVDAQGKFLGKLGLFERALDGCLDPEEVRREVRAQWQRLAEKVPRPTHADGHHHAHVFPGVAEGLAGALPSGTWVRMPVERALLEAATPGPAGAPPADLNPLNPCADPRRLARWLAGRAERAAGLWKGRFRFLDGAFHGLAMVKGYDAASLLDLIQRLTPGIHELMVHPGEMDPYSAPFSAKPEREREVAALCDPAIRAEIAARGIELIHYGNLS